MRTIIRIIFAVLTTNAQADWDTWSDTDRQLFVASQIAITADWITTRYGVIHRNELSPGLQESNILLGPYPSVGRVNLYFLTMLATNYYIADAVPADGRGLYLFLRTVTHGSASYQNVLVGWQLRF